MTGIAIFGNTAQSHACASIRQTISQLAARGYNVAVECRFAAYLGLDSEGCGYTAVETIPEDCELLLSFGGDGTFLHAARWTAAAGIPVLGINTGHLGYLAAMPMPDDPADLVEVIDRRAWITEPRRLLQVSVEGAPGLAPEYPYALNEVAFLKDHSASTITCSARLGDAELASYPGDGLLVSTPTGSTGYNLSVGGPVVQPNLDVWLISPVASHALTLRPLVVSTDKEITVSVHSRTGSFQLALDGTSTALPDSAIVRVSRAPFTISVVRQLNSSWLGTLTRKLLWGARTR